MGVIKGDTRSLDVGLYNHQPPNLAAPYKAFPRSLRSGTSGSQMEKKMETTIIGQILGLYWDKGKEKGNYYNRESIRHI